MPPLGFDYHRWAVGFPSEDIGHTETASRRSSSERRQGTESPCSPRSDQSTSDDDGSNWQPPNSPRKYVTKHTLKAASFETEPTTASPEGKVNDSDGIPMETASIGSEVSCTSEVTEADQINFERPPSQHKIKTPVDRMRHKALRDYWEAIVLKRHVMYGTKHIHTANGLMDLAHAQLSCEEYVAAATTYASAVKIYRSLYGESHISVAHALDKLGLAISMSKENLEVGLTALEESFSIRCKLLGKDHVDSLDTLNNIACVYLNLRQYEQALKKYQSVFRGRGRIFGRDHPSVGVTAYTLAWILQHLLCRPEEAREYFSTALDIYQTFGMSTPPEVMASFPELKVPELNEPGTTKTKKEKVRTEPDKKTIRETPKTAVIVKPKITSPKSPKTPKRIKSREVVEQPPRRIVSQGKSVRKITPRRLDYEAETIRTGLAALDCLGTSKKNCLGGAPSEQHGYNRIEI